MRVNIQGPTTTTVNNKRTGYLQKSGSLRNINITDALHVTFQQTLLRFIINNSGNPRSLIFQHVVGVDDKNYFFCGCGFGALQPCRRQLDEDVILEEQTDTHVR